MADSPSEALSDILRRGNRRESLEALRDRLASAIDNATPRQMVHLAPTTKQLVEVLRAIEELPDEAETDPVNEIAARRAKRLAG